MTTREKAATVVMSHASGTDPAPLADAAARTPGGLILMGDNVPDDRRALRRITAAISASGHPAPLIAIDQEGGDVARLPWDDAPSARELKAAGVAAVEDAFVERGDLLSDVGITVNFGVVADVPRGSHSFIFSRAYGTDPSTVAAAVAAATRGEEGRTLTTLKHFPGHGAAEGDSHSAIPTSAIARDAWNAGDAKPFEAGIEAGADLVMMGHLRLTSVDDRPASLSPAWYRVLRVDLGFDGVAVTDDLGMLLSSGEAAYADPYRNAVNAIAAGADLVLTIAGSSPASASRTVDAIAAAATGGDLSAHRLDEAATRVMALRFAADSGADRGE